MAVLKGDLEDKRSGESCQVSNVVHMHCGTGVRCPWVGHLVGIPGMDAIENWYCSYCPSRICPI